MESFDAKVERLNDWMWQRVGVILGPGMLFLFVRVVLDLAGRLHWALEVLITLVLAALLVLILWALRGPTLEQLRKHPLRVLIAIFCFTTLLAVTVFSALSLLLLRWYPDAGSRAAACG